MKDTLSQQTQGPYMSKVMALLIIEKYGRFILKSVLFAHENPISKETAVLCVCWLASETNNLIINSELMREGKQP